MAIRIFFLCIFLCALIPMRSNAENITVTQASLGSSEEGIRLTASYAFHLPTGLAQALKNGIPLIFTTDVEVTRPRWYWFDAKLIIAQQSIRIAYNILTRQYRVSINESLPQSFAHLDDALSVIKWPRRWLIAPKGIFEINETYDISLRMQFDTSQLPKPFQISALNDNDWRLTSGWRHFTFKLDAH